MAKILSTNQQVTTGVQFPRGVYSRIVSCADTDIGVPGEGWAYTDPLADSTWLLAVDVWVMSQPPTTNHLFTFGVHWMYHVPKSMLEMQQQENLLPIRSRRGTFLWDAQGPDKHFRWEMNRLFSGQGLRFGVVLTGAGAPIARIQASFEVSEG